MEEDNDLRHADKFLNELTEDQWSVDSTLVEKNPEPFRDCDGFASIASSKTCGAVGIFVYESRERVTIDGFSFPLGFLAKAPEDEETSQDDG